MHSAGNVQTFLSDIQDLRRKVEESGFELHLFNTGWYNELVGDAFKLDMKPDSVGVLLVSTPSMFDKYFIPYLKNVHKPSERDPLDASIDQYCDSIIKDLKHEAIVFHDYDMDPRTRRPKILMQTVGHVAGAAYFYQDENLSEREDGKKLYPVSVHPKFGGWFAFRIVLLLPDIQTSLVQKTCPNLITDPKTVDNLLILFSHHWKDNRWRDVSPTVEKYSDIQQEYFNTPPKERGPIVQRLLKM